MHGHSLTQAIRTSALALGTMLTLAWVCTTGHAQWLPDRNYTEGPGIRVGNLELHPGVALRAGYDSNVFRQEPGREQSAAILAVTPHLHLSTLSQQRMQQGEDAGEGVPQLPPPVEFRAGLAGTYFYYTLDQAPKNFEIDTDAMVHFLPGRPVGFALGGSYTRTIRPFTAFTGVEGNTQYAVNNVTPTARLLLQSRSKVLSGSVGYNPLITRFESQTFQYLNSERHVVDATAAWKFLPDTALIYDGALEFTRYRNPDERRAQVLLSEGTSFGSRLGINGALTNSLGLRILAGYALFLFENDLLDEYETVIGEAVLAYRFRSNLAELGYRRDVLPSRLGGWMQRDRGFTNWQMLLGGVFALRLEAGVAHVNYGRLLQPDGDPLGEGGTDEREDLRIDGGVHAEYRATNWLAIMADFTVFSTLTDFDFSRGVDVPPDPAKFTTIQVFGGVRAHY